MATVPRPQSSLEGAHPMSSTARVLSAAALASAVVGFAASAAFADPGAEVSPATGSPGGSVTVSVTCESAGGPAPQTLEATSQAFDEGTVQLQRVPGNDAGSAPAAYRGTARIASDGDLGADSLDAAPQNAPWTVDGTCPAKPGGQAKPWSAKFQVDHAAGGATRPGAGDGHACAQEPKADSCPVPTVPHGVQAGEGGTFTDSVPALVAGGLLIAGALGATAYRLWQQRDSLTGR
jgi:hypothetical protein